MCKWQAEPLPKSADLKRPSGVMQEMWTRGKCRKRRQEKWSGIGVWRQASKRWTIRLIDYWENRKNTWLRSIWLSCRRKSISMCCSSDDEQMTSRHKGHSQIQSTNKCSHFRVGNSVTNKVNKKVRYIPGSSKSYLATEVSNNSKPSDI